MKSPKAFALQAALRSPAFWGYLALSTLPPEILSRTLGWSMVDPGYLAVTLLWWPVDTLGRLAALRILLKFREQAGPSEPKALRSTASALGSALAAEVLASLRASAWALLGLIPSLFFLSQLGPDSLSRRTYQWGLLGLAGLGLLPAGLYLLRRILAPVELLRAPLGAREALDASAARLAGRLRPFIWMALPWLALDWALEGASLALPDWIALVLALPALAATLVPLALAEDL